MKRIKDFIYNKSDIFVALIIVCIAAFVIVNRIEIITAYPSTLAAEANAAAEGIGSTPKHVPQGEPWGQNPEDQEPDEGSLDENMDPDQPVSSDESLPPPDTGQESPGVGGQGSSPSQGSGSQGSNPQGGSDLSLTIEYGMTGDQIADALIRAGLLETRQQFYNAVAIAGAETKLQAGTFTIPANASPDEIVSIITR
ncbi:MAG: hypothetical protein ACOX5F_08170 [Anaerovoracaceae bacterium]|jgi:hypothetical protein